MTFVPIDIAEMESAPAFGSNDANVVRAILYLLDAAWRSPKTGTVPSALDALSRITRLSPEEVEKHWETLFSGWELLEDGSLGNPRLMELGKAIEKHFPEEAKRLLAQQVLMANPESSQGIKSRKRLYPNDFEPNETSRMAMIRAGFITPEEQAWVLNKFADFGRASRRMYADWQATFRNFVNSAYTHNDFAAVFGYRPGQRGNSQMSAVERLRASIHRDTNPLSETFAQRQLNNARTVMTAAMAKRRKSIASSVPSSDKDEL